MELNSELLEFRIGDENIIKQMSNLPVGTAFAMERMVFLNEISRELLFDKETRHYPDVVTFAFWIRKANMEKEALFSDGNLHVGRGVLFHIAPSNVAVNYAYSFAVGFVLGNANIVRLPTREYPQIQLINLAVQRVLDKEEYKKWKPYLAFVRYKKNKEINDYFSFICDMRIIWGGDATIREIRKSGLSPRAGEVTFADRYSVCIIEAEKYMGMDEEEKNRLALRFYNDTYLTDQNACSSPRLICWMGEKGEIQQAKEIFWEQLWNLVTEKYVFQPVQYVDKLTNSCLVAAAIDGIHVVHVKDNQIVRIELERIDLMIREYRGNSGFFYEYDLKDIMELVPICDTKLQTVALLGDKKKILPLIYSGVKGIDRIVEIGYTMEFGFVWDGYDLRESLTRRVW